MSFLLLPLHLAETVEATEASESELGHARGQAGGCSPEICRGRQRRKGAGERQEREASWGSPRGPPRLQSPAGRLPALRVGPRRCRRSLTAPRILVSVGLSPASDWSWASPGRGGPGCSCLVPALPSASLSPHTCGWGQAACQLKVSSARCHHGHQASTGSSGPHRPANQGRTSGALRAAPQPAPPDTWQSLGFLAPPHSPDLSEAPWETYREQEALPLTSPSPHPPQQRADRVISAPWAILLSTRQGRGVGGKNMASSLV